MTFFSSSQSSRFAYDDAAMVGDKNCQLLGFLVLSKNV